MDLFWFSHLGFVAESGRVQSPMPGEADMYGNCLSLENVVELALRPSEPGDIFKDRFLTIVPTSKGYISLI